MKVAPTEPVPDRELDDRALETPPAIVRWLGTRAALILFIDIGLIIFFELKSRNGTFLSSLDIHSLMLSGT